MYAETRALAELRGEKYYFTGKPCVHGHMSLRWTKTGICCKCSTEHRRAQYHSDPEKCRRQARESWARHRDKRIQYLRDRYTNNREHYLGACRDYYQRNKKKAQESRKEWFRRNPEKQRKYRERWRQKNRGLVTYYTRKRQKQIEVATPSWADQDEIRYIYSLAGEKGHVVDHIVPLTSNYVCGLHCPDNMRVIPESLNIAKRNKYWPDMPKEIR